MNRFVFAAAVLLIPRLLLAEDAAVSATAVAPSEPAAAAAAPEAAKAPEPAKAEVAPKPAEGEQAEYVGASTCLACHAAKEDFKSNIHAKAWPAAKKIEFEQACETCHGPGSLHAAANGDRGNPGFATIKLGPTTAAPKESSARCLQCHEGGERLHWDGSKHDSRGVSCTGCHGVHAGHRRLLKTPVEKDTCLKCHMDVRADFAKSNHHPVPEGKLSCSSCHKPHGSEGEKLLKGNTVVETCFLCHAEKRGPYLFEHRPVTEDCTVCHKPHGSTHGKLLTAKQPFLCQSCHSNARHPGTMYAIDPRNPAGNTFQELNNRAFYRACVNCHNQIHGSNHPTGVYFLR